LKPSVHTMAADLALPPLPQLLPAALEDYRFSSEANWLIRGHVLVGRYPGSCPSRPITASAQQALVESILHAGVDTFVCLQAELPPQAEHAAACRAAPPSHRSFVPYFDDAKGADMLHFRIRDMRPAESVEALDGLVRELACRVRAGRVLYIHCWVERLDTHKWPWMASLLSSGSVACAAGGRGRTGMVAACLLGALYPELDSNGALERVQTYFNLRAHDGGLSPETDAQRQQVLDWFRKFR